MESTIGGYGPVEKTYHLCRRRRWLRPRTHVQGAAKRKEKIVSIGVLLCGHYFY